MCKYRLLSFKGKMSELVVGLFTPPSHGGGKPKIKQYPLLAFPPPTKISPPPVCLTQREAAAVNEQVPAKKESFYKKMDFVASRFCFCF